MLKGAIGSIKANSGTVAGVLGGFFVAGTVVNLTQTWISPILGAKNVKFAQSAAAGGLTIVAFILATKAKGEFMKDAAVGFGAVALGHMVNGLLSAFGTQA
jgi:hypothetical protein